jgi:hypothetical protein
VLLTIPRSDLSERSLFRTEHDRSDWQAFVPRYGGEAEALRAIEASQQRRIDALRHTKLEYQIIDTAGQNWDLYAERIARWMGWGG